MANSGYGKRHAPHERPRTGPDFAHLPAREASIAALIDRLPEGAAIDGKTLASVHPHYGQAACLTALRRLSDAGHLRRFREPRVRPGATRWVSVTYFSRTARDEEWWRVVQTGRTPQPDAELHAEPAVEPDPEPAPCPAPASPSPPTRLRSRPYDVLATLGRKDSRLALSAADCTALEPLAAEWFTRGASEEQLVRALLAGLPPEVHSPRGLLRTRLRDKVPPERGAPREPPPPRRIMECTVCGAPGRPEALPGGICASCRNEAPPPPRSGPTASEVHAHAGRLRALVRTRERTRT